MTNAERTYGVGFNNEFLLHSTAIDALALIPEGVDLPLYKQTDGVMVLTSDVPDTGHTVSVHCTDVASDTIELTIKNEIGRSVTLNLQKSNDDLGIAAATAFRDFYLASAAVRQQFIVSLDV